MLFSLFLVALCGLVSSSILDGSPSGMGSAPDTGGVPAEPGRDSRSLLWFKEKSGEPKGDPASAPSPHTTNELGNNVTDEAFGGRFFSIHKDGGSTAKTIMSDEFLSQIGDAMEDIATALVVMGKWNIDLEVNTSDLGLLLATLIKPTGGASYPYPPYGYPCPGGSPGSPGSPGQPCPSYPTCDNECCSDCIVRMSSERCRFAMNLRLHRNGDDDDPDCNDCLLKDSVCEERYRRYDQMFREVKRMRNLTPETYDISETYDIEQV